MPVSLIGSQKLWSGLVLSEILFIYLELEKVKIMYFSLQWRFMVVLLYFYHDIDLYFAFHHLIPPNDIELKAEFNSESFLHWNERMHCNFAIFLS